MHSSSATRATQRSKYVLPVPAHAFATTDVLGPLPADLTLQTPPRLYAAGNLELLRDTRRVAIVGAREASDAGQRRARKLAAQLARGGVVVVSGLAKGIDRAAHEGALEAGGRTVAVIGTPLDRSYPAEHAQLQELLCREHLVVSQFALGARTLPSSFVARSRTMALLSHASVIVEASDMSGSLSQAAETLRLRRPLFVMESALARIDLKWPARMQTSGAMVLRATEQVLSAI